jgi:hypothetical protein
MAFAQPQRQPRQRSQHEAATTELDAILSPSSPALPPTLLPGLSSVTAATATGVINHGSSPMSATSTAVSNSDHEADWHVISSALRTPSSSASRSAFATPPQPRNLHIGLDRNDSPLSTESSEPESFSSFRPSDTESDIDYGFDVLPSHDGTGAFMDADLYQTSEEETPQSHHQATTVLRQPHPLSIGDEQQPQQRSANGLSSSFRDFEPNSPSMPNILLPNGGIHLPSFASHGAPSSTTDTPFRSTGTASHATSPTFQPTVRANDIVVSSDEQQDDSLDLTNTSDDIFTRKRPRNLDT